jgi:hypothetical protein
MEVFVNAYSSIGGTAAFARRRRLFSRAYRKGLRDGFGAPFLFFKPMSFSRTESIDTSVEMAWNVVGKALSDATKVEEEQIVKATGKARGTNPVRKR